MVSHEENHGFVRTEMVFRRFQIFQAKGGGGRHKGSGGHNRKVKGSEFLDSLWRRRGKNFTQGS